MPGTVDGYLAQLLSWSNVDYLMAYVFVVEAIGMVLVRYRSGGRLRWLSPLVPLILGGWAFLLGQFANDAYQRLVAGPDCIHCSPVVGQILRAQVVQAYSRVYPQSMYLLVAGFICLMVVVFVRRPPSTNSRAVLRGAFLASVR